MTQQELKQIIISGCKFKYKSYDFRAAKKDFIEANKDIIAMFGNSNDRDIAEYMSDNLKEKHIVWREGKIWKVEFGSNGDIYRISIGKYLKFSKTFYIQDFGESVFSLACP